MNVYQIPVLVLGGTIEDAKRIAAHLELSLDSYDPNEDENNEVIFADTVDVTEEIAIIYGDEDDSTNDS